MTMSPRSQLGEQRAADRALLDRNGTTDAFLDHDAGEGQAVHVGVAFDLASLNVEAFALGGLSDRRDPAVAVNRHLAPLSACQLVLLHAHS